MVPLRLINSLDEPSLKTEREKTVFLKQTFATLISVQVTPHLFMSISFQMLHIHKLSLIGSALAHLGTSKDCLQSGNFL